MNTQLPSAHPPGLPRPPDGHGAAPTPAAGRADANGTTLRLRALHVMGHGCARIAAAIGVPEAVIQRIVRGDARTVTPAVRDAITGVYDRWWDKRAPARTQAERAAAGRARRRAQAAGWCAPAALDDDLLDRPGYQPSRGWRPATGTGTATHPRTPHPARDPTTTSEIRGAQARGQASPGGCR
jgi:hypothetical protein